MIARVWRGVTRAQDADSYLSYLRDTGIAEYRRTPGNRGVFTLRRISGDRAEFVLLTLWESLDAVRAFAGVDIDRAVYYADDERFLIERGERVDHFDVLAAEGVL